MQRDNQDFSDICRAKQGHVKLAGYVSYSYIARCATLATRAHPSVTDVHYAQCTNISTHGNASFVGGGYALCRWKRLLCAWERALYAWKRRCADVRAGTQAPPLPIPMIFFHTNKITIYTQSTQTTPTTHAQSTQRNQPPTRNLPKRNRRGGACVPARTSA